MSGKKWFSGYDRGSSIEPMFEYVVEIKTVNDFTSGMSIIAVLTVARSEYEARDKIHSKFMHIYPKLEDYSMGIKKLVYKKNPIHLN